MPPIVIRHSEQMQWEASPRAGVWRKRLEHVGAAESGRVTSIVRFDPGASFPRHPHPGGEEILVLSGVFSDERGDHSPGTYMLNPEGFEHAPFSRDGCTLFVKLRQAPGTRDAVCVDTTTLAWSDHPAVPGIEIKTLYQAPEHPETATLTRIPAGADLGTIELPSGEEIFVVEGDLADEHGRYRPGSWIRFDPGTRHSPRSEGGCVLYVKRGHL